MSWGLHPLPPNLQEIFQKKLSKIDTKNRLALPTKHLHHFMLSPDASQPPLEFAAVDLDGSSFNLRLKVRRGGYLKPEITGDWLRFVRAKNLKPLDKVIFYKHPTGSSGLRFTVAVRRAVLLFGADISYAPVLE